MELFESIYFLIMFTIPAAINIVYNAHVARVNRLSTESTTLMAENVAFCTAVFFINYLLLREQITLFVAFYRRLLILEMNVKPAKIDLRLDEKLQSEVQFSIFMAVRWLHEMYEKGRIPESENSKRLVNELYKDADSVKAWLEDCMKPAAGARCSRTVLYDLYDKYCEENDRQAIGRAKFYKNLVDKGYKEGKDRTVGRYIEGLDEKGEDFVDAQAAGVEVPFK